MRQARMITCADCGGHRRNAGRGLCSTCHSRRTRAGTLDEIPRPTRVWVDLVADADALRERYGAPTYRIGPRGWTDREQTGGITWPQVAERLGVTPDALDRARCASRADNAA